MRCALYARDPDSEGDLHNLANHAAARGWRVYAEYLDIDAWDSPASDLALAKLIEAAREHAFECVLVPRIASIASSIPEFIDRFLYFDSIGVKLFVPIASDRGDEELVDFMDPAVLNLVTACMGFDEDREEVCH